MTNGRTIIKRDGQVVPCDRNRITNAIFNAPGIRIRELPVREHDLVRPDFRDTDVA